MSQAILHPNLLDSCVRDELNNTATRYDSLIPACVRHLVMFLQSYGRSRSGQGCGRESGWCTGELASSSLCFRRTVHCTVTPLICVFFTASGSWSFEHTSPPRKGRTQGVLWSVQSVHWCFWLQGGIYTASHAHNTYTLLPSEASIPSRLNVGYFYVFVSLHATDTDTATFYVFTCV